MKFLRPLFLSSLFMLISQVACASSGLIQLSVYDRAQELTLDKVDYGNKTYIVGNPANEYQVVLKNPTQKPLLAVVSVGGINVISGETASPNQSGYVLDPGETLEIKGWRKSMAETAAFYFTEHKDSYAARIGRGNNTGVIGVAVFKAKAASSARLFEPQRQEASRDAAPSAPKEAMEQKLGTGHGRSENSSARYADFQRASSIPDEIVMLYYDSYRNLVAKGVLAPCEPLAFPARFVTDPPRS